MVQLLVSENKEEIKMRFGYARVSGTSQDLKEQVQQLIDCGIDRENIYAEKYTGTKKERPQLNELLSQLRKDDEVFFTKVDRIGRTVKVGIEIIDEIMDEKHCKVYIKQLGNYLDKTSMLGKLNYQFLLIMAEFEHDITVQRLAEGKAYAKKVNKNYREGRPKRRLSDRYLKAIEYKLIEGHSYSETEKMTGISVATVKRIVKQYKEEVIEEKRADTLGWMDMVRKVKTGK